MGLKGKMFMLSLNLKIITKYWLLLLVLMVMAGGVIEVKGQSRTYAGILGINSGTTNASNAIAQDETFATVAAPGLGAVRSMMLLFANTSNVISPNTTVFIKVNTLNAITITAYAGSTPTAQGAAVSITTQNLNSPDGKFYIAISSSSAFNSVKIEVAGGLTGNSANVYYAFYNLNDVTDCGKGMATSVATSGVLVGGGVTDPNKAIDSDPSSFAYLTLGTLAVIGTVTENVYFSGESIPGDAVRATISVPSSLLSLGLISNISIQAYKGNSPIGTPQSLSSLLTLDLLGLLGSNAIYTFYFVPGQAFDRVEFVIGGTVSLLGGLNLYDVQRVQSPLVTEASPLGLVNVCGTSKTINISNPQSGITYSWYNVASGGTALHTGTSYNITGLTPGTTTVYYVEAIKSGCSNALRNPIQVKSIALPVIGPITGTTAVCVGTTTTLSSTPALGIWSSSDPSKATVTSTGLVTGVASGTTTITYTYTDPATGCSNSTSAIVNISFPTASISGSTSVCQSATSPNITFTGANGTAPYTFTYNINGGSNTTITTTTGNTVTLSVPTATAGTFNYNLVSVKESSATQCSNSQTGTATVVINPKPLHPITSISSN